MKTDTCNNNMNLVATEHNKKWLEVYYEYILPYPKGMSTQFIPVIDDPCLQDQLVKIRDRAMSLIYEATREITSESSCLNHEISQEEQYAAKRIAAALNDIIIFYGNKGLNVCGPKCYYFSLSDDAITWLSACVKIATRQLDEFTRVVNTMGTEDREHYAQKAEILSELSSTLVKRLQKMNDEGEERFKSYLQTQITLKRRSDSALGIRAKWAQEEKDEGEERLKSLLQAKVTLQEIADRALGINGISV
jgi:hypothetical protein